MATDFAWAAGFFDGEGSVSVRKNWNKLLNRHAYQLYVKAAQVEREPLEKMQRLFGGAIGIVKPHGPNDSPAFDWAVTGPTADLALKLMLPYLTLKRERALLGIEFQLQVGRGRPRKAFDFPARLLKQQEYYERMKVLNLRYAQRRAAAETESRGSQAMQLAGSDSPVCIDSKDAESGRNDRSLRLAVGGSRSE